MLRWFVFDELLTFDFEATISLSTIYPDFYKSTMIDDSLSHKEVEQKFLKEALDFLLLVTRFTEFEKFSTHFEKKEKTSNFCSNM